MPCRATVGFIVLLTTITPLIAHAEDWPQWLGSQRDGVWREVGTVASLKEGAVPVRWRAPIGGGYAGPAVAAGRVIVTDFVQSTDAGKTAGQRGRVGVERIHCLDEKTGTVVWTYEYPCTYGFDYGSGPRATPVVDGDRVYTLGGEGHLHCLDVATGKPIWSKHFADDKAATPIWGYSSHPLIDGDKLICLTGPSEQGKVVTSFDKRTGAVLWTALKAKEIGYCPPTMVEAGGVRQLIAWHPESINSLDPETGKLNWSHAFGPVRYGVSITTPRHVKHPEHGDLLVVSSYWDGTIVLKLDPTAKSASLLWERAGKGRTQTGALHSLMAPPLMTDTHLYGMNRGGELRCLDLGTGEVLWETYAATTGDEHADNATAFLVPNPTPDKTFLFNESGEMILAKLSPAGYEELGRTHLLQTTNTATQRPVLWCHPALANRSVYWRNDREIVAFSLADPKTP
jgi:outer membrane protein assembly factor BamB